MTNIRRNREQSELVCRAEVLQYVCPTDKYSERFFCQQFLWSLLGAFICLSRRHLFLCRYRPTCSSSANEDLHTILILLHFLHYLQDSNRNASLCRLWHFDNTERTQVGKSPFLRHRPALSGAIYRTWGVAAFALPIGVTAGQHPNSSRCSSTVIPSVE